MMNRHPAYPTPWMLATERRVEDAEAAAEGNALCLKRIAAKALVDLKTLSFDDAEPIPGHDLVDLIAVLELAAGIDPRKYGTVVGDIVRDRECSMSEHPANDLHHADGRFWLGAEEITPTRYADIDADWVDEQIERAMAERVGRSAELGSVV